LSKLDFKTYRKQIEKRDKRAILITAVAAAMILLPMLFFSVCRSKQKKAVVAINKPKEKTN